MTLLLNCQSLCKSYGAKTLFDDISLGLFQGDRLGIIGPNGSGKSTFFKILAQVEEPDSGQVVCKQSLRMAYVPQDFTPPQKSLEEVLLDVLKEDSSLDEHEKYTKVAITLGTLGFEDFSQKAHSLSGGWIKRLSLAKALVQEPELLFLDEPTNHLDLNGILFLESFLKRQNFTYVLISHDRFFLQNTCSKILELNRCYPKGFFSVSGSYAKFLEKRQEFLEGQRQTQKSLASKVRREVEWLKATPKARTTKSQSRVQQAEGLIEELSVLRSRNRTEEASFSFSSTEKKSKRLLVAKNLSVDFNDSPLFSNLDLLLTPGLRLGLVGANGSGKTSLLRLLSGELTPSTGSVKKADSLQISYFDQLRARIDPNLSLKRALSPEGEHVLYRGQRIHVNSWCKRFLFSPNTLDLPVHRLSGGERARIHIARLICEPADVLLLDEPTNDLDIPTLEVLEESLKSFPGAVVLITHDRYLLTQVCNAVLGIDSFQNHHFLADYSQWKDLQKEQESKKVQKAKKTKKQDKPRLKMSYKEKKEWEQMEGNILDTEKLLKTLQTKADDPSISSDPQKLQSLCEEIRDTSNHLDSLYARWQELEEKEQ